MLRRAGAAFLAAVPAANGWAQPAPPPPAAPRPAPGQDDIVVTAPQQQSSIDRQTYLVRDTPEARSATSLDILSRLPSVEVQADNSLRLVGAGTATVLIDGRRVNGDPATVLRNLQGAQIERIEVMTNPGAQFPAQGTGGIVNIVTRRNYQSGLGGSATATGGRFDTYELRLAPTYGTGNWTFSGNAGYFRGDPDTDYRRERFTIGAGGPVLDSSETGVERDPYRYFVGNGTISYRPSDRQTLTLTGTAAHGDFTLARDSLLTPPPCPAEARPSAPTARPRSIFGSSRSIIAAPAHGPARRSPPPRNGAASTSTSRPCFRPTPPPRRRLSSARPAPSSSVRGR